MFVFFVSNYRKMCIFAIRKYVKYMVKSEWDFRVLLCKTYFKKKRTINPIIN